MHKKIGLILIGVIMILTTVACSSSSGSNSGLKSEGLIIKDISTEFRQNHLFEGLVTVDYMATIDKTSKEDVTIIKATPILSEEAQTYAEKTNPDLANESLGAGNVKAGGRISLKSTDEVKLADFEKMENIIAGFEVTVENSKGERSTITVMK